VIGLLAIVGGLLGGWLVIAALLALGLSKAIRIADEIDEATCSWVGLS
jgi:hypothetical protein